MTKYSINGMNIEVGDTKIVFSDHNHKGSLLTTEIKVLNNYLVLDGVEEYTGVASSVAIPMSALPILKTFLGNL